MNTSEGSAVYDCGHTAEVGGTWVKSLSRLEIEHAQTMRATRARVRGSQRDRDRQESANSVRWYIVKFEY